MAYVKRYTGDFYNLEAQHVEVEIHEMDFPGGTETIVIRHLDMVRSLDGQIIATSVNMEIINTGDFDALDPLLTGYEKQFLVKVFIDSTAIFEGFVLYDVMEQALLPQAGILITASDYLKRLKDIEIDSIALGSQSLLIAYIQTALIQTGFAYALRINSDFFARLDTATEGNTLYEQILAGDDIFFKNEDEKDSAYEVLQAILKINDSYLYVYNNIWHIERSSDAVETTRLWTTFATGSSTPATVANQYNSVNKQNKDFDYTNRSQVVQYVSGLKLFSVNLMDEVFGSLVYNNFEDNPSPVSAFNVYIGSPGMNSGEWYADNNNTIVALKYNMFTIKKLITWTVGSGVELDGMFYQFDMNYNPVDESTVLKVSYRQYCGDRSGPTTDRQQLIGRFTINKSTATAAQLWLNASEEVVWRTGESTGYIWEVIVDNTDEISQDQSVLIEKSFDLSALGADDLLTLQIGILPMGWRHANADDDIEDNPIEYLNTNYMGDVSVSVGAALEDNVIDFEISEDCLKKDDVSIKLFDIASLNYKNGLIRNANGARTTSWEADGVQDTLVNHLGMSKFAFGNITRFSLKGILSVPEALKPFTIITDNNKMRDSSVAVFVLSTYRYDFLNNFLTIDKCDEYGDEDILVI